MKKIIICGGHFPPALALIEKLSEGQESVQIFYLGPKYVTEGSKNLSLEYQAVKKANIKFFEIQTGRLQRRFTRFTLFSLAKIPIGFAQSLYFLLKIRPHLIISFGSYVSTPTIFSGWLLGTKSITYEPAQIPGLATKINSIFTDKIFTSFENTHQYFSAEKCQHIGPLFRKSLTVSEIKNGQIKSYLQKIGNSQLIYITGGNQGSHAINKIIFQIVKKLENFSILHQIGTANYPTDFETAQKIKQKNYQAVVSLDPGEVGAVIKRASMVISRAGANTAMELALLAKPSILIPLSISSGREQEQNAKMLEIAGSAIIIHQKDLNASALYENIQKMKKNSQKYQKAAQDLSKTIPTAAAARLAVYITQTLYH